MKKYILLALLPCLMQESLYAKDQYADLDAMIINELRAARKVMNNSTKLELESILHALVSFAKKGRNNRQVAINGIVLIKKALQECKDEQYKTSWDAICSFFSSNPKIVMQQIDPALKKVNKALADLKVTQSEYNLSAAAITAVSVVAIAVLVAGVKYGPDIYKQFAPHNQSSVSRFSDAPTAPPRGGDKRIYPEESLVNVENDDTSSISTQNGSVGSSPDFSAGVVHEVGSPRENLFAAAHERNVSFGSENSVFRRFGSSAKPVNSLAYAAAQQLPPSPTTHDEDYEPSSFRGHHA